MNTRNILNFNLTNCDDPYCSICSPDEDFQEDFTGYDDLEGYCMTNHGEDCDAY